MKNFQELREAKRGSEELRSFCAGAEAAETAYIEYSNDKAPKLATQYFADNKSAKDKPAFIAGFQRFTNLLGKR